VEIEALFFSAKKSLTITVWVLPYSIGMNLHVHINPHSGLPVYRQIIDQIKYYIASSTLKAGQQLPSVRELAQRLSVNPTTIVKAYAELEHEEIIEIRHGRGAFVARQNTTASEFQKDKVVRRLARQLAVESMQIGASHEMVMKVVNDEWEQLADNLQDENRAAQS
jgi:GntR family transcriptional regulator